MRTHLRRLAALLLAALILPATGANWPNFRGPDDSGVSRDKGLPVKWGDVTNLIWKTRLPGPGASSPIIWADRVFVTCYTGYGVPGEGQGDQKNLKRHLLCIDRAAGKILWDKAVDAKLPETQYGGFIALHGYASSTPATDGKHVYAFFGKSGVFAYDFRGNQVWHADVGSRIDGWGSATSPLLHKDLVILNASVESGALLALRKEDGKEAWRCPGINRAWNSPVLVDVGGGRHEVVVRIPTAIVGVDPASGKKLWTCGGFGDSYVCPTVVARSGVVYSLGGRFQGEAAAVRAGGKGDVTNTRKLWSKRLGGPIPSPVPSGDLLAWVTDNGSAHCVRARDGEPAFMQRLAGSGTLYASPTLADGKIYVVSRANGVFVLAAGPKYQLVAHNTFGSDRSVFNGSPAVSSGQLFLRSDKYLYCIGKK
jgi:hypothetical protein